MTKTFYQLFEGKDDCLLAALRAYSGAQLLQRGLSRAAGYSPRRLPPGPGELLLRRLQAGPGRGRKELRGLDPTKGFGAIEHEGAFRFEVAGRSIPIRALQVKTTQRRAPLSAKVGGSQLKLARVASPKVDRQGFGERIEVSSRPKARTLMVEGARLALGAETAATFNEVFAKPQERDGVFVAGEAMGTVSFTAQGPCSEEALCA